MAGRTMNWKSVEGTLLIVHGLLPPEPKEWDAFISETTAAGDKMQQVLVFADISLSPVQRKQVADSVAKAGTRAVAVVCFSPLTRTLVTGLGWMTRIHRAFAPAALDEAFEFLKSTPSQRAALLQTAKAFASELNHSELLQYLDGAPQKAQTPAAR